MNLIKFVCFAWYDYCGKITTTAIYFASLYCLLIPLSIRVQNELDSQSMLFIGLVLRLSKKYIREGLDVVSVFLVKTFGLEDLRLWEGIRIIMEGVHWNDATDSSVYHYSDIVVRSLPLLKLSSKNV